MTTSVDWREQIVCDPGILCGKPTLKGTRLSVEFVLDLLASGFTRSEIDANYPNLSEDRVKAALSYAADTVRTAVKPNPSVNPVVSELPRFEMRFPKNAKLHTLPNLRFIVHLMAYFEAINSAIRWHVLIGDNPERDVIGDLDSFLATIAAIAWSYEAIEKVLPDVAKVFDRSELEGRPDALAFWDRAFARPQDPMIKAFSEVRMKYFGHLDPRVINKFIDYQSANGMPTPFLLGDASGTSKGCRYPWPIEACIFELMGVASQGSYANRTDAVFADFKAELKGMIVLLSALIDVWFERNNLTREDAWEIERLEQE